MIDRIQIAADTTWSAGPVGADIDCDVSVEAIKADARRGGFTDSLVVALTVVLAAYLDPAPLGRVCTIIAGGETFASGVIVGIDIDPDGIRMRVEL